MKILNNVLETIEELKTGSIITFADNGCFEPRYYRYNKSNVEFSDDLKVWKKSSLELLDFTNSYIVVK